MTDIESTKEVERVEEEPSGSRDPDLGNNKMKHSTFLLCISFPKEPSVVQNITAKQLLNSIGLSGIGFTLIRPQSISKQYKEVEL